MSTQIKLIKLQNGEELIGKVNGDYKEEDKYLYLDDVRALVIGPGQDGKMAASMIPWFITMDKGTVKIKQSMIMSEPVGELPKQLEDGYLQQTSGLHIVPGL